HSLAIGAIRHDMDRPLMVHGVSEGAAGGGIPEPRRPVPAADQERLPIGAEGHGPDRPLMPKESSGDSAGDRIPEPRHPVLAPDQDGLAIGAEYHDRDTALEVLGLRPARQEDVLAEQAGVVAMVQGISEGAAGGGVPDP